MQLKVMNPSSRLAVTVISAPTHGTMDENNPRPTSVTTVPETEPACVKNIGATGTAGSTGGGAIVQPDPLIASSGPSTVTLTDSRLAGPPLPVRRERTPSR